MMEENLLKQSNPVENSNAVQDHDVSIDRSESSEIDYIDCTKCFSTVAVQKNKENMDPNGLMAHICKNCKSANVFEKELPDDVDESIIIRKEDLQTQCNSVLQTEVVEESISPLTSTNTLSTDRSFCIPAEATSGITISKLDLNCLKSSDSCHDNAFSLETTHMVAASGKAPKNTSNFFVVNFYQSSGVFESDLEVQLKDKNEKKVEKFYAGVDVVFKSEKKVFTCQPLLCPAKVHYEVGQVSQCDVIVGIILDSHGGSHPLTAIYDSFHQFKNFAKGRTVIHTLFTRHPPTSIAHDFDPAELALFSKELYQFLNFKSPLQEKEGS